MSAPYFNIKYRFPDTLYIKQFYGGVIEDLEFLRREFFETSQSFVDFADVWKKHRFASIFCVSDRLNANLEFTEGLFHYIKGYIFSSSLSASVFGIYLAYAFYHKHILPKNCVKLRLTLEEVKTIKELIKSLHEAKQEDAVFIFISMFESEAIHFTATSLTRGIEGGQRKYFTNSDEETNIVMNDEKPPFDVSLFHSFADVFTTYNSSKKKVFGEDEAFSEPSDFLKTMKSYLNKFGTDDFDLLHSDHEPMTTEVNDEPLHQGVKRREIKTAAFGKGASTSGISPEVLAKSSRAKCQKTIQLDEPSPG